MIYLLLADGFEQSEALVPADILSRAGYRILQIGVSGDIITSSHGTKIKTDLPVGKAEPENMEMLIIPGGKTGVENLIKNPDAEKILRYAYNNNIPVGIICAAASFPGRLGMLSGKRFTCFPGFEQYVTGGIYMPDENTVADGSFISAKAAGVSFEFGFRLLDYLKGQKESEKIKKSIYCDIR